MKRYKTKNNAFMIKAYRRIRKHKKAVLVSLCVVVGVLILFFVIKPLAFDKKISQTPQVEAVLEEDQAIDDATLAGLIGDQKALNAGEGEFAVDGIKIGLTMTSLNEQDISTFMGVEKLAAQSITDKKITDFYVYDAKGDENQQIQDVFSLINSGVRTLIIVNTTDYNFAKILDIAKNNNVACITYNMGEKEGVVANIVEKENAAVDFANFIKSTAQMETYVTSGNKTQLASIKEILPITKSFSELSEGVEGVSTAISEEKPIESMICFSNSPNDLLKSWLDKGLYPKAYACYATVDIIKSLYEILNYEVESGVVNDDIAQPQEATATATTNANASGDFNCFALTKTQNTGDILFEFALNIAEGKKLPEANYLYEISAQEAITKDNLAQYYEKVKDEPSGFVYSNADISQLAGLFS